MSACCHDCKAMMRSSGVYKAVGAIADKYAREPIFSGFGDNFL